MRRYFHTLPMLAMEGVKLETRRQILMNFYRQNLAKGKNHTVQYFLKLGVPKRSIYNAIHSSLCRGLPGQVPRCLEAPNPRQNPGSRPTSHHQSFPLDKRQYCQNRTWWTLLDLQMNFFSLPFGSRVLIISLSLQFIRISAIFDPFLMVIKGFLLFLPNLLSILLPLPPVI